MVRRLVRVVVHRLTGYDLVRIALGILLLTAAGLKAHQLATEPVAGTGLLDSGWLLMATVEFELFFGLWLLANLWPKPTWAAALACFSLFACVSLYKALSGYATCGCFGSVAVNPWYTVTLDLVIVLSLLRWRPNGQGPVFATHFREVCLRAIAVLVMWLSVGLPAAFAMVSHTTAILNKDGIILGDGNLVVLEPQEWVGSHFPLLPFIEDFSKSVNPGQPPLRERLGEGEWFVVLYRQGCPRCRKILAHYRRNAEQGRRGIEQGMLVAIVEIPPVAEAVIPVEVGVLSTGYRWFLKNPTGIHLRDGMVELVKIEVSDAQIDPSVPQLEHVNGPAI
jgi:hypothetical protein